MIKRGMRARIGYIWGEGVTITGSRTKQIMDKNFDRIFSDAAHEEMEGAAGTDGNLFFLLDKKTQKIIRVPMGQITQHICDPDDTEFVQFLLRVWTVTTLDPGTGTTKTEQRRFWYPTVEYALSGESIPVAINGTPVEQDQVLNHIGFNKQVGWVWGVPDLFPVMFWARAYKEFLESQYTLVKSLARFAFKVTDSRQNSRGSAGKSAAIKIASMPNMQGNARTDVGATIATPGGLDLTAVNKAGASIDFNAGRPLAAMVAAGLEINLVTIVGESDNSSSSTTEATIDLPTVKAMRARQGIWGDELAKIFRYLGASTAKIKFPPIQSAPIHRVIQAIITAAASGVLFPAEVRDLITKAMVSYGMDPKAGLPDPGEWAKYANPTQANPGTTPISTPDPTGTGTSKRSPAGATSDGSHEMRPSQ